MRLWHKDLIPVLPRQQLLGQWRECCAIARNIAEKGTPNHILVNKIMEYQLEHFESYALWVCWNMKSRGYACDPDKFLKWIHTHPDDHYEMDYRYMFYDWHNDRYLMQCYYNLQEKYDCGGISEEEWSKIRSECIPRLFW